MALQASFSSSSFNYGWTFDVFLNFRGTDTRYGFTGNLYKALCDRGIRTFIDDEELQRGDEITPSLVKAIQESRIAIPVLSKNYASSSFCLDELATIMECVKGKGRLVLPVFYDVDPSDVRHHRGTYGEALARHEERFKDDKEKVQKWREALHQATNLSGEDFKLGNEYEYVFIEKLVKEISNKISHVPLHVADYPIGLESRVLNVNDLLNDGSNARVHMVGIYGIGGIGKTTVARAVYNLIADQFEGSCFLENVRETSIKHGLPYLQQRLLSKILRLKDIKLASASEGISIIKHRFQSKKVLLVLDDVDKLVQLQAIVGRPDWFGFDSRVIITTRDKHLLATHGVKRKYEVEGLNKKEALEFISWNAFKYEKVDPSYTDVLNEVVSYASGLPLALEVIGSNLFGRSVEEWIATLGEYKKIPNKDIQKILKLSFDGLEEYQQKFFLDIACCFKGHELVDVEYILHAHHDVSPKSGIRVLVDRSLIKINQNGVVTLHDLIQDMGKEIVRQESPEKPGKRSRLWLPEDIMQVLQENTGTSEIQIIVLEAPISEEVEWDGKAFKKMKNLKTLIIQNGKFFKGLKHLPNSLRVLEWGKYPSQFLPSDFHPKKLTILKLPGNCLTSLQLIKLVKNFVNMRVLNFNGNKQITQIPDTSGAPNVEELNFEDCKNLINIDDSVGFLGELRILNLRGCRKLRSLPSLMLPSLENLELARCRSLESFPEILGKMEKLTALSWYQTSIEELPCSICNLTRLRSIHLNCRGIFLLPSSIFMLRELYHLGLVGIEGLLLPNQDEGVEQVSSAVSATPTHLSLLECNLSDELLQMFLPPFSNVQLLTLSSGNFTILPACKHRGIPPNIECLFAPCCPSMSCSSRRMLLKKDIYICPGHIYIFDLEAVVDEELLENEWNQAVISLSSIDRHPRLKDLARVQIGIHIIKERSSMDDIRFIDPLLQKEEHKPVDMRDSHNHHMQQQQTNLASLEVHVTQGKESLLWLPPSALNDNLNWDSSSKIISSSTTITVQDQAAAEKAPGESSHTPGYAETQNIQAPSPTSSSGKASEEEPHLKSSCTASSPSIDKYLRNKNEQSEDDVEMDACYASLDAGIRMLSHSHDKLATTAPSKEAKEALKSVQDFIFFGSSVLLHPEWCSNMKAILDYLSNLSPDDGIPGGLGKLISEASQLCTHWTREYVETSMKIDCITSKLQRADELEMSLEGNKEKMALENEMLEEQVCVVKANTSVSQSEKSITRKRKREIFEEEKTLKAQLDELRKNVPRWEHEHTLAKKTQANIRAGWSKLREKFEKMAIEWNL